MEKMKKNVPEFRFKDDNGNEYPDWEMLRANKLFKNHVNKSHNGDLPILAITQDRGAILRDDLVMNIISSEASVKSYKIVEVGDFVISLRSFQGGIEYSNVMGICSPAYTILKPIIKLENAFYKYYLKKDSFIQGLSSTIEGIRDGKQISYEAFSSLKLSYPSLSEQQKIASFLTAVDEKLQTLKKKKTLLEQYKKGVMQKIFSQELRFKDENGNEFPDWEEKTIEEVTNRITTKNKSHNTNVLTISAQYGLISQLEFFNKSVSAKDVSGYYLLEKNDFAYNKSYSKGYPMGAIKRLKRYNNGVVSTLYICFRNNEQFDNGFAEQYFETGIHNKEIEKVAQEGARNHGLLNIGVSDFFNTHLFIPSLPEQTKIASFLSTLDEKINLCTTQIEKTEKYKKGLLQKMFC